jgi:hypothetical protein
MTLQSNRLAVRDVTGGEQGPPPDGKTGTKGQGAAGAPSGTSPAAGDRDPFLLPDVDMDISASIRRLVLEKFEFSDVRGSLRISRGVVTMQNLAMNAFGGSIVSSGSLDLTRPARPAFDLKLALTALEAASLLSPFTAFGQRLNGAMTMTTALKGTLDDTLGLVTDALQGTGSVGVRIGAL